MSEVDTSAEAVERVMFGLRPMNGSNEMDAGVAMIEALVAERDTLRAQLATARADALEEAYMAGYDLAKEWHHDIMPPEEGFKNYIRALKETTPQEKK